MTTSPRLSAAVIFLAAALSAFAAAPDPVEGKWVGTVGSANNPSVFSLEIKRDDAGHLLCEATAEMLNYYVMPMGELAVKDGHYTSALFDLQLVEGKLSGTFGSAKRAVSFSRVEQLPVDPPIPRDLPAGPGPRWRTVLGSSIYAAAAVRDGHAYVGNVAGVFVAVKIADGSVAWNFPAGRAIFGEALATDGAVYFVCDNGYLYKLNRADGQELWRYDLGDARSMRLMPQAIAVPQDSFDHFAPQPVLAEGVLYVGAGDGGFHAVCATTGERVWRIQSKGAIRTTAAIDGDKLVFGTMAGLTVMVERATGKEVWQVDRQYAVTTSPVFIGGKIIGGARNNPLEAYDPATGKSLWQLSLWFSWIESTAVDGGDGHAFIGSSDHRRVLCFDPKDGHIVWRTDVFGDPWGRPVVTGRFVYIGAGGVVPYNIRLEGGLCALDRTTGRLAWRWPMPNPPGVFIYGLAASPARAGDLLIIGGLDGTLYAFPAE